MDAKNKIASAPRPIVLVILDGWGINQDYGGNAITKANTPTMNKITAEYPVTTLRASGESVGLPWGEVGNSEVGHMSLGLGRIVYQDLPRINKEIIEGSFYRNEALVKAVQHVKKNNSKLHLMGLASDGCVHSTIDHLYALLLFASKYGLDKVFIHAILDGRDAAFNSGRKYINDIERNVAEHKVGQIATVAGRFYAMDRNNNWDRTAKAYLAMTEGQGNQSESAIAALEKSYKKKIYDEEFVPTVICKNGEPVAKVEDDDAIIVFNYRPDRTRQITKAFVLPEMNKFKRPKFLKNFLYVGFEEYENGLPMTVAFPEVVAHRSLGEILSANGMTQLRIAETEKYAHVTYFFNGGREARSFGEDNVLIPSPAVSSYDQKPEMSAAGITQKVLEVVEKEQYDFILINFANPDMVGHTGNFKAVVKAVEAVDSCLDKVIKSVLAKDGLIVVTADHGNAEQMYNMQTGQIDKEHTTNPVPFILVGKDFAGRNFGWPSLAGGDLSVIQPQGILSDVAPTIIKIMKLKKPKEMTGVCLIG
ncbi:MAG: 2,3-bisphosphoglycerate-independent phosphoglycerate mutase [Candidatus Falkowbacteria bacterium]|nr:2,3-bisphosphoglycerate-independent phosphoglycerate mutase [Candidatus Falkowbacteria bacterium]